MPARREPRLGLDPRTGSSPYWRKTGCAEIARLRGLSCWCSRKAAAPRASAGGFVEPDLATPAHGRSRDGSGGSSDRRSAAPQGSGGLRPPAASGNGRRAPGPAACRHRRRDRHRRLHRDGRRRPGRAARERPAALRDSGGARATGGTTGSGGRRGQAARRRRRSRRSTRRSSLSRAREASATARATQGGVSFASQSSAYSAVSRAASSPGNATGSSFYTLVNGGRMPPGGKLPAAQIR